MVPKKTTYKDLELLCHVMDEYILVGMTLKLNVRSG